MSCLPVEVCANCGEEASGIVKLKDCTACRLVKYCGVDCQRAHRKQHKKACKERAAELKDERLYGQGLERSEGEICPICLLAIPMPTGKHSNINPCCSKMVCNGCLLAAYKSGIHDRCPFCRAPMTSDDAEILTLVLERVKKKDPDAILSLGNEYMRGGLGLEIDSSRTVELWTEAAELGSADAYYHLGLN